MKPEYIKGPEARENFERLATKILQTEHKKEKKQPKETASQENEQKSDKD